MRWGELLAAVGERQTQERADGTGTGLEGVILAAVGPQLDLPAVVRALLPPSLDRHLLACYLGQGSRPVVIAAPPIAEVRWAVWQPQSGPPVRQLLGMLVLGDRVEHLVLSHLLAYGAGDLLTPPEQVTDRGIIRRSTGQAG